MRKNLIRFDEFLNDYLYGPDGYYTGYKTGTDYSTLVEVSPPFSKFIAAFTEKLILKNSLSNACIADLGAGSGRLSAAIASLNKYPVFAVEISEAKRKSIEENFNHLKNLRTASSLSAIENFPTAIIIAHEFFDALPVRVFRKHKSDLKELYFCLNERKSVYRNPEDIPEYARKFASLVPDGTVFEFSELYEETVKTIAAIERAVVIVIDYGFSLAEIERLRRGTLRGFSDNLLIDDIESLISGSIRMDITHSVNFTILNWIFESYRFEKSLSVSLGRFVAENLLEQRKIMSAEEERELLKALLPHRFGDSFHTVIYTKNAII
jgi:SAM-dependent MidA family methyltransferase